MKKIIILVNIIVLVLSSCSKGTGDTFGRLYDNSDEIANKTIENLIKALESKEKTAITEMFSKDVTNNVENFDESIEWLLEYYQGEYISRSEDGSIWATKTVEYDEKMEDIHMSYDIQTAKDTYRIAIYEITLDNKNPDNVGIRSLYIIRMEEDVDPEVTYRGDGKDTLGINIGVKNMPPQIVE